MNNLKKWVSVFLLTVFFCSKAIHTTQLAEDSDTHTIMLVFEQDSDISPYNDDRFDV